MKNNEKENINKIQMFFKKLQHSTICFTAKSFSNFNSVANFNTSSEYSVRKQMNEKEINNLMQLSQIWKDLRKLLLCSDNDLLLVSSQNMVTPQTNLLVSPTESYRVYVFSA